MTLPRLVIAVSAFVVASSNVQHTHAAVWKPPDPESEKVAAVKKEEEDVPLPSFVDAFQNKKDPIEALITKPMSAVEYEYEVARFQKAMKDAQAAAFLEKIRQADDPRDSGDLMLPNPSEKQGDHNSFGATYGPHRYNPKTDSEEAIVKRFLQEIAGSPYACIKDLSTSCNYNGSCTNSPNIHVEPFSCTTEYACANSLRMIVGMMSCTGGARDPSGGSSRYPSCFDSPFACIGQRSCTANTSISTGACVNSDRIHVANDACVGGEACLLSPGANIKHSSCQDFRACTGSSNITVNEFSCRADYACYILSVQQLAVTRATAKTVALV